MWCGVMRHVLYSYVSCLKNVQSYTGREYTHFHATKMKEKNSTSRHEPWRPLSPPVWTSYEIDGKLVWAVVLCGRPPTANAHPMRLQQQQQSGAKAHPKLHRNNAAVEEYKGRRPNESLSCRHNCCVCQDNSAGPEPEPIGTHGPAWHRNCRKPGAAWAETVHRCGFLVIEAEGIKRHEETCVIVAQYGLLSGCHTWG